MLWKELFSACGILAFWIASTIGIGVCLWSFAYSNIRNIEWQALYRGSLPSAGFVLRRFFLSFLPLMLLIVYLLWCQALERNPLFSLLEGIFKKNFGAVEGNVFKNFAELSAMGLLLVIILCINSVKWIVFLLKPASRKAGTLYKSPFVGKKIAVRLPVFIFLICITVFLLSASKGGGNWFKKGDVFLKFGIYALMLGFLSVRGKVGGGLRGSWSWAGWGIPTGIMVYILALTFLKDITPVGFQGIFWGDMLALGIVRALSLFFMGILALFSALLLAGLCVYGYYSMLSFFKQPGVDESDLKQAANKMLGIQFGRLFTVSLPFLNRVYASGELGSWESLYKQEEKLGLWNLYKNYAGYHIGTSTVEYLQNHEESITIPKLKYFLFIIGFYTCIGVVKFGVMLLLFWIPASLLKVPLYFCLLLFLEHPVFCALQVYSYWKIYAKGCHSELKSEK